MKIRYSDLLILLNIYSLYFVETYWLKDGHHSSSYKYSTSISILLVINCFIFFFLDKNLELVEWKIGVAVFGFYPIIVGILFSKRIENLADNFKEFYFSKYYLLFIVYLVIGGSFGFLLAFV